MTYNAIAAAAQDQHLRSRIAACIAQETPGRTEHPIVLADQIQWRVVTAPPGSEWRQTDDADLAYLRWSHRDKGIVPAVIIGVLIAFFIAWAIVQLV